MRSGRLLTSLLCCLVLLSGCDRAAEMIPGQGSDMPPVRPSTGPAPIEAPPLLAPGSLRLAGSAGAGGNRAAISDGELGKAVVHIQALDDANPPGTQRSGAGVMVDRQQQLILTSYQLVYPFRPDGSRAYSRLLVGPAGGTGEPPEFAAVIAAANPQFDVAVLRITGLREGASQPAIEFGEAVLADTASLRRADRIRLFAQPARDRAQPIQIVNSTITGFSGDGAGEPRAYLKTDARLPGAAIGAPAFDQSGSLVGVASQLAYDPGAPVALVRPLAKALDTIEAARSGGQSVRFTPALQHPPAISGTSPSSGGAGGIVVSRPVFAENALEGPGFRDLFDYTNIFRSESADLDYEFVTQGIAPGTFIQELWYLNGTLQDALSSSYTWAHGNFAIVSDRLTTPNPRGIPTGVWRLEVWVGGAARATATAYVGVAPPEAPERKPEIDGIRFASTASAGHQPDAPPSPGAGQLLAFFNYRQAARVQTIRWVALRDGRVVLQSPPSTWYGGESGTWWVGVSGDSGGVGPGAWEFQIYFDNVIVGTARTDVR
jgi:S1-C subfamily serine protease